MVPGAVPTADRLRAFGPMRIERGGATIVVPRGDAQRLLGYLALKRADERRESIVEVLWPDQGAAGRRCLSDTIYRIRRRCGPELVRADADTVGLGPGVDTDVREFDHLAAGTEIDQLERAVALYDELVPGIYDDWAVEQRTARHRAHVEALRRLAEHAETAGSLDRAAATLRRLLVAEPFDETAHQCYLRLLGRLHRYAEARAHFEALDRMLAEELGAVPLPETIQIVKGLDRERELATVVAEQQRPFVGRVTERAAGVSAIEAAVTGRGGVLCIEGVAGIGKTRLLAELIDSARWRRVKVASTSIAVTPERSSLEPLARALRPVILPAIRLEVADRLDEQSMRALGPLLTDEPTGREGAIADGSNRLRHALSVLGAVLVEGGTIAVVLDDVHWASTSTWEHLDSLASGFVPGGGLLVVAYRRPEVDNTPGWTVLQNWDRTGLATILPLEPLHPDEAAALVGTTDAVDIDEVLALTGGVPFNIIRGLDDGDWGAGRDDRVDRLGRDHRRALEAAAVLGRDVGFRAWAAVLGTAPLALAALADGLVAERWLTPNPEGYAFVHDLVRSSVHDRMGHTERTELHARAAAAIAELEPDNWRRRAHHLDEAGQRADAARAHREAGRAALARLAMGDACESFHRAWTLLPTELDRERMEVVLECRPTVEGGGQRIDRAMVDDAIETARRLGDDDALLRALLLAGGQYSRIGDDTDGLRWLAEAETLARAAGDPLRLADVQYRRAALVGYLGRWPDAERELTTALGQIDQLEHPAMHRQLVNGLAEATLRMGRPAETVGWLEDALRAARAAGDSLAELRHLKILNLVWFELCEWDRLAASAEESLTLARRFGAAGALGTACQAVALAALAVGDRRTAKAMIDEARTAWAASGNRRLLTSVDNTLGLIAEDDGDEATAIAHYEAALVAAAEIDAQTEVAWARHDLGTLHLAAGRPHEAVPLLRASVDFWTEAGNQFKREMSAASLGLALLEAGDDTGEPAALAEHGLRLHRSGTVRGELLQEWLWTLACLLARLDRRPEAGELLDAAHRELLRQAATISDLERRRGFFERVPLNRAIMAAVDARSGSRRAVTVRLASSTAPLGRTLRPDEYVDVQWTVDAADDATIDDPAARRRHRLVRLLGEAAAQGAAPTDDDLAVALGVSRRTVLRDLAVLGERRTAPTRRRAAAAAGASAR